MNTMKTTSSRRSRTMKRIASRTGVPPRSPAATGASSCGRWPDRPQDRDERHAVEDEQPAGAERTAPGTPPAPGRRCASRSSPPCSTTRRWRSACGSTSSITNPRRAGLSNAPTMPSTSDSQVEHRQVRPTGRASARRARTPAQPAALWVSIVIRRLSSPVGDRAGPDCRATASAGTGRAG